MPLPAAREPVALRNLRDHVIRAVVPVEPVHIILANEDRQRVGDFGKNKTFFAERAKEDDLREVDRFAVEHIAPGVMWLLFNGGVDGAFESEIVGDSGLAHGGRRNRMWRETSGE